MRTAILAAVMLVLLPVSASAAGKLDPLLDAADLHMRHHGFAEAITYYEKAIAAEPGAMLAHFGLVEAIRRSGKDPLPEYEQRYTQTPDDPVAACLYAKLLPPDRALEVLGKIPNPDFFVNLLKARAFRSLGRGEATSEIVAAEGKCPGDGRTLSLLAAWYEESENFEKAADLYAKALEVAPGRVELMVGLGNSLRLSGKLEEAKAILEKALVADKEDPEIPYRVGLVALAAKDAPGAVKAFDRAKDMTKDDVDVHLGLGDAHLLEGKPELAEAIFAKAVELAPRRVDARRRYAYALDLVDKNDDALTQYRELLKLDPLNAPCRVAIGWILAKKEKFDDALKEFRQAADMDATDPVALFFVGYIYDRLSKWGEASDTYEKLVKKYPDYARAWNNLGLDQDLLGKGSQALASLRKAVDLDPDNPEYLANLGNAYYNAKKFKEAQSIFADLVDAHPEVLSGWTGLARCQNQLRRFEDAAAAYEKAIELSPEEPDLHLIAGIIYHEHLKDYQMALDHYEKYLQLGGTDPVVEQWMEEARAKLGGGK